MLFFYSFWLIPIPLKYWKLQDIKKCMLEKSKHGYIAKRTCVITVKIHGVVSYVVNCFDPCKWWELRNGFINYLLWKYLPKSPLSKCVVKILSCLYKFGDGTLQKGRLFFGHPVLSDCTIFTHILTACGSTVSGHYMLQ